MAGRRRWRTPGCSANATTPRSTTASASTATPQANGTPTAPTARRSMFSDRPPTTRGSPERGDVGCEDGEAVREHRPARGRRQQRSGGHLPGGPEVVGRAGDLDGRRRVGELRLDGQQRAARAADESAGPLPQARLGPAGAHEGGGAPRATPGAGGAP